MVITQSALTLDVSISDLSVPLNLRVCMCLCTTLDMSKHTSVYMCLDDILYTNLWYCV